MPDSENESVKRDVGEWEIALLLQQESDPSEVVSLAQLLAILFADVGIAPLLSVLLDPSYDRRVRKAAAKALLIIGSELRPSYLRICQLSNDPQSVSIFDEATKEPLDYDLGIKE